jgi:hypothetical protein
LSLSRQACRTLALAGSIIGESTFTFKRRFGAQARTCCGRLLPDHAHRLLETETRQVDIYLHPLWKPHLEVADAVEPLGRFRCVLALARECGRRINAIVNLRATDVLLSPEQIEIALAAVGAPTEWAAHWPHGAVRWRAEFDKMGYVSVTPLSPLARRRSTNT